MQLYLGLFLMTMMTTMGQEKVLDFQWKNRLLIFPRGNEGLVVELEGEREELDKRQLRVFILEGEGVKIFPASAVLGRAFRERLDIGEGDSSVYLIGKDGQTTLKWGREEFSFKKLYASIDKMPMRQREMRDRER